MSYISSSTLLNQAWRGPKKGTVFNKPVQQSSTYDDNNTYKAGIAVNASRDGNEFSLTKEDYEARWEINLDGSQTNGTKIAIDHVNIWNRTSQPDETSDFYVHVSNTPFASTSLSATLADPGVTSFYVS